MAEIIQFIDVGFTYSAGTPFAHEALRDINLSIQEGSYTAVIGQTGSGKSTLLQLINGLNRPSLGRAQLAGQVVTPETPEKELKDLRRRVGTVFQFPESQLFAATVGEDIAFGPQNFGYSQEEALAMARDILPLVGLPDRIYEESPFDLSGGQQRRVAIAGVLVMEPDILLLDEPTAGLDPQGQEELMDLFQDINNRGTTVILVTHRMEQVAEYADQVLVMEAGTNVRQASPREVFQDRDWLRSHHLDVPQSVDFAHRLQDELGYVFPEIPLTSQELAAGIQANLKEEI